MITAQLATIPSRSESVRKTIESLLPQVDELHITINDVDAVALEMWVDEIRLKENDWSKIKVRALRHLSNKGDAEKLFGADTLSGYVLTCDDDLIYPPDYAAKMIEVVDRYNGRAIISLHGRELKPGKIASYYAPSSRLEAFRCLGDVPQDHLIQHGTVGTGVMAWNADKVKIEYDWFQSPNMADVWLAVNAKRLGIPMVIAAHREGWLTYIDQPEGSTIWEQHFGNDQKQTEIWNRYQE